MIKGLYSAVSAMLAEVNQQSTLAHNIANINTPGFKSVLDSVGDFYKTTVIQPATDMTATRRMNLIGELGLGVENAPEGTDFTDGPLQFTGQSLDMALQGPGFFRVQTLDGERYTRDGRFSLDVENNLVTFDGYKVLDDSGQPIQLTDPGPVSVAADGTLFANGQEVGKLGLASFNDPKTELVRDQTNTYKALGGQPTSDTLGQVQQNYLEGANINTTDVMTKMVQVARHYEAAQQMVSNQDELLGLTISSLGKL